MNPDRPDRPSHDDELRAELAKLDELLRKPAEPENPPPVAPTDFKVTEPVELVGPARDRVKPSRDLAVPSRGREVMRTATAAHPAPPRTRVAALWLAALSVGLLAGGLLGWWHAVNPPIDTPEIETAVHPLPAPVPARKARGPSKPAKAAPLPRTAPAPAAALPTGALPPSARAPGIEMPPAATTSDPTAIVGAIPVAPAPAPAIEAPLAAAPLPVAPSLPPAAPPAVAPAGGLAAAMVAADEAAIETTLRRYEDAYERLDAKAAVAVWPSVDQRALSRAFAGLASQTLNFRGCEVIVRADASTATASCSGTAEYVRKVGDARVRVEPRQWTFTLNKTQGAWRIEAVDGSR
jgi:hypothetical protein